MSSNDNEPAVPGTPAHLSDPHGPAALLLVESLIHGLCERSLLTPTAAVAIVDRAAEVQAEVEAKLVDPGVPTSHGLLVAIGTSLRTDSGFDPRD